MSSVGAHRRPHQRVGKLASRASALRRQRLRAPPAGEQRTSGQELQELATAGSLIGERRHGEPSLKSNGPASTLSAGMSAAPGPSYTADGSRQSGPVGSNRIDMSPLQSERISCPPSPKSAPRSASCMRAGCFVIPNPWDIGTARYLQHLGFKALATTSAGFAFARGFADGGGAARRDACALSPRSSPATDLPVNADFEGGYARRARGRGGERAAVRRDRRRRALDRGFDRRQGQAALRLRSGGGAHEGGARGDRQGRRRRRCSPAAPKASSGRPPRSRRDDPPAQGVLPTPAPIASTRPASGRASRSRRW